MKNHSSAFSTDGEAVLVPDMEVASVDKTL